MLKIWKVKILKLKMNIMMKKKKKKKVREKKYYEKKEIINDIDSDGFEIIGSKEEKRNYQFHKKNIGIRKKIL